MSAEKLLFTLHYPSQIDCIVGAVVATTPDIAAKHLQATFRAFPEGPIVAHKNVNMLGMCGTMHFAPELFREPDEVDIALSSNAFINHDVCFVAHGFGLTAKRGQEVVLWVREQYVEIAP